jgi:hypothetical protein
MRERLKLNIPKTNPSAVEKEQRAEPHVPKSSSSDKLNRSYAEKLGVDLTAENWGVYLGAIARAVALQYRNDIYDPDKDPEETCDEDILSAIRRGFLKAFEMPTTT